MFHLKDTQFRYSVASKCKRVRGDGTSTETLKEAKGNGEIAAGKEIKLNVSGEATKVRVVDGDVKSEESYNEKSEYAFETAIPTMNVIGSYFNLFKKEKNG